MSQSYGQFLLHLADAQTDLVGIRTIVRQQTWVASRSGMSQEELDAEEPAPPAMPGGMMLVGAQTRRRGGGLVTAWTWRGVRGDGKSVTFKERHNSFDSRFDPGFEQVPIQHHPDFISLRDDYGGFVDGNDVIWSPTLASGSSGVRGLGGANATGSEELNPMFGRQDYFSLTGTYTHRYVSFTLDQAAERIRQIHSTGQLPGRLARTLRLPTGLNWLKAPSQFIDLGFVYEVVETYWLSPEGGWPEVLYRGRQAL